VSEQSVADGLEEAADDDPDRFDEPGACDC
jgi:hypothetical protein